LLRSIASARAPVGQYASLGHGARCDALSDEDFCELVQAIGQTEHGWSVAVDLLWCRLQRLRELKRLPSLAVPSLASELLLRMDFDLGSEVDGTYLGELARAAFSGPDGHHVAERFVSLFDKDRVARHAIRRVGSEVLSEMMALHPNVAIPALVLTYDDVRFARLSNDASRQINPIHAVNDDVIKRWVDGDVDSRAWRTMLNIDAVDVGSNRVARLSALAEWLIDRTSAAPEVLNALGQQFRVDGWTGSATNAFQPFISLAQHLCDDRREGVRRWAATLLERLRVDVHRYAAIERHDEERFE
jgi:hypothetical protein